jgi:hypothetical protein
MRTDEMMFPIVEQWKKSGLSIKAFASSQGLNNFSFQYWCKKYKAKNSLLKKLDPKFIPITIKAPVEPSVRDKPKLELHLPCGLELIIY